MLGAIAVPLAPAAGYALVALVALFEFAVVVALGYIWVKTFGKTFQWLGGKTIEASVRGVGFSVKPFGFLLTLDREIQAFLSQAAALSERAMVSAFGNAIHLLTDVGVTIAHLSERFYHFGAGVGKRMGAFETQLLGKVGHGAVALIHKIVNGAIAYERKRWDAIWHRTDARARHAQHTADIAYEFPRARLGKVEKTTVKTRDLRKWLKATLLGTLGTLVVARALGKLGLGCLTGRNGKRAVKSLCGINPGVLDALLMDAALLTVAFNLEDFAKEMQTITAEAARLINNWAT